jgi:hypothetical protein
MLQRYTSRHNEKVYLTLFLFFTCMIIFAIIFCACSRVVDYTSLPPAKGTTHTTFSLRSNSSSLNNPGGGTPQAPIHHQLALSEVVQGDWSTSAAEKTKSPLENSPAKAGPTLSQCVTCHTDVKRLIRLGWEIEKIRPKKGRSAETSGEG